MSDRKYNETRSTEQNSYIERYSKMILETSMDGFCVVGLDGRLLEVSSSLCDMLGYSKEEFIKMECTDTQNGE